MYAHTDLGDFYRGKLSLRQILVRIRAMPLDAPLLHLLARQQEEAEQHRASREVDDTLSIFKPRG